MGGDKKRQQKRQDQREWGLLLLVTALFLFIAALFLQGQRGARDHASIEAASAPVASSQHRLNRHIDDALKNAQLQSEIEAYGVHTENQTAQPLDVEAIRESQGTQGVNPLVFDQDDSATRVLRETEAVGRQRRRGTTPDQRISQKLERDEWLSDYERKQREEYVRQFIENARRSGIDVRLNENLEVTGIEQFPVEQPIRVPQSLPKGAK